MIKSNEVRIGNVIMWQGKPTKLSALHIYTMFDAQDEAEEGSPIAITPEVLHKTGFEIDNEHRSYKLKNSSFMVVHREGNFFYYNYCDEDDYYSSYWPEITSLHHLQNLYSALTGEELTTPASVFE